MRALSQSIWFALGEAGTDLTEGRRDLGAGETHGHESDDGDENDEQSVLNHRGALVLLNPTIYLGPQSKHGTPPWVGFLVLQAGKVARTGPATMGLRNHLVVLPSTSRVDQ